MSNDPLIHVQAPSGWKRAYVEEIEEEIRIGLSSGPSEPLEAMEAIIAEAERRMRE